MKTLKRILIVLAVVLLTLCVTAGVVFLVSYVRENNKDKDVETSEPYYELDEIKLDMSFPTESYTVVNGVSNAGNITLILYPHYSYFTDYIDYWVEDTSVAQVSMTYLPDQTINITGLSEGSTILWASYDDLLISCEIVVISEEDELTQALQTEMLITSESSYDKALNLGTWSTGVYTSLDISYYPENLTITGLSLTSTAVSGTTTYVSPVALYTASQGGWYYPKEGEPTIRVFWSLDLPLGFYVYTGVDDDLNYGDRSNPTGSGSSSSSSSSKVSYSLYDVILSFTIEYIVDDLTIYPRYTTFDFVYKEIDYKY